MKAHVSEEKKGIVKEIATLLEKYPVIGSVDMTGLPASQLQQINQKLRETALLRMTKKRLINLAIQQVKEKKVNAETGCVKFHNFFYSSKLISFLGNRILPSIEFLSLSKGIIS